MGLFAALSFMKNPQVFYNINVNVQKYRCQISGSVLLLNGQTLVNLLQFFFDNCDLCCHTTIFGFSLCVHNFGVLFRYATKCMFLVKLGFTKGKFVELKLKYMPQFTQRAIMHAWCSLHKWHNTHANNLFMILKCFQY